jgi:transketolase
VQSPSTADSHGDARRERLDDLAREIRLRVLEQSKRAHVGHIGSSLSIADLVAVVYGDFLSNETGADRDRFILSKGHAALALYAAMAQTGRMDPARLDTFCADASELGGHPESTLDGIDFATGSLGHGLSIGAGAALAARMQRSRRRVAVLMSDAECNEGSVWEAAMFAAHHKLGGLLALLDLNGQQAIGHTRDVLDQATMADRWRDFGWDVHEVDGHDVGALCATLDGLDYETGLPHILIATTTFGCGVSYMERKIAWHYMPMTDEQYALATSEVGSA